MILDFVFFLRLIPALFSLKHSILSLKLYLVFRGITFFLLAISSLAFGFLYDVIKRELNLENEFIDRHKSLINIGLLILNIFDAVFCWCVYDYIHFVRDSKKAKYELSENLEVKNDDLEKNKKLVQLKQNEGQV